MVEYKKSKISAITAITMPKTMLVFNCSLSAAAGLTGNGVGCLSSTVSGEDNGMRVLSESTLGKVVAAG